jgi:hypothetical protein
MVSRAACGDQGVDGRSYLLGVRVTDVSGYLSFASSTIELDHESSAQDLTTCSPERIQSQKPETCRLGPKAQT